MKQKIPIGKKTDLNHFSIKLDLERSEYASLVANNNERKSGTKNVRMYLTGKFIVLNCKMKQR